MKKLIYYLGLIFLAFWLFTIHSKFAFALDPLQNNETGYYKQLFVFLSNDLKIALPYIWGATFAIATTVIVALLNKKDKYFIYFAIAIALLELTGVFLFNYPEHGYSWLAIASIYYGIYAGIMVFLYIYISYENSNIDKYKQKYVTKLQKENNKQIQKPNENEILQLIASGMKGTEIAKKFNIHPSKVSRIKNKKS